MIKSQSMTVINAIKYIYIYIYIFFLQMGMSLYVLKIRFCHIISLLPKQNSP